MKKTLKNIINKYRMKNKKGAMVEKYVSMSRTTLSDYVRICYNTEINDSKIGTCSYIGWDCVLNNALIGAFSSIGPKTEIIYGTHPIDFISTSPVFYSPRKQCGISFSETSQFQEFRHVNDTGQSIVIGNDVWIGYGVRIIESVTIHDGAIVLAGAVVTKDVEPYAIVGGVPAKTVRYRFSEEEIGLLEQFQWWHKDLEWIQEHSSYFLDRKQFFSFIDKMLNEEHR